MSRRFCDKSIAELTKNVLGGAFYHSSAVGSTVSYDYSQMTKEEIAERLAGKEYIKVAYLSDKGIEIKPEYKTKQYSKFVAFGGSITASGEKDIQCTGYLEIYALVYTGSTDITKYLEECTCCILEDNKHTIWNAGYRDGTWVLLDYGDIVVHVFSNEAREFYSLERLWKDGTPVDLSGVLTAD